VVLNQATLANAEAQAAKSVADLKRVDSLAADGSLSLREQDSSKAAKAQTAAAVAQARASLEIAAAGAVGGGEQAVAGSGGGGGGAALKAAKVDLDNTRIVAPEDGQLGQVTVRKGAYVNTGAQLMGLVPKQLWVIANLKETQMNNVQVGQPATFKVDALDGAQLTGVVERISPATGSEFSVLPADNATGNYVKIAQRIPVRIRIDPGQAKARRLAPGMSVIVSIDTSVQVRDTSESQPATGAKAMMRQLPSQQHACRLRGFGAAAARVQRAAAGRVAQRGGGAGQRAGGARMVARLRRSGFDGAGGRALENNGDLRIARAAWRSTAHWSASRPPDRRPTSSSTARRRAPASWPTTACPT
jgi:multidrug efflux pump subunit AcrA (membrane-fusion protein)